MCTRPKLIDVGYLHYKCIMGAKSATRKSFYKFCPCGMCIECRNMRREEYTQRLKHEIETSNYVASFITLTYRDDELPLLCQNDFDYLSYNEIDDYSFIDKAVEEASPSSRQKIVVGSYFGGVPPAYGSTLSRSDAKKFCDKLTKRFRRKYGKAPLKYICAGEYGDDGHRPHFHLIVVGLPASERMMVYDAWNKGRIDIEPVGNGAIRYTLSYIDKQVFGANDIYAAYGDFEPPFCLFSKGIGKTWIEKNINKFNEYGKITFGASGKSYTLNPYYRKKYNFKDKPYITSFSDSVVSWAEAKKMSLYEAYVDRCKLKELELQHKQIKRREPLYICSKAILKKDWDLLKRKRNISVDDCAAFTSAYLKRDDFLIFNYETVNNRISGYNNIKSIRSAQRRCRLN